MKKMFKRIQEILSNRELIIISVILVIAVIYIVQLFNLQIVNGSEYRNQSQKKMLRTETIEAARGPIVDRNEVVLATNELSSNVEIYKVKAEDKLLDESIAKLIQILDKNSDKIYSTFPVNNELTDFKFLTDEEKINWQKKNNMDTSFDFNKTIDVYIKKYGFQDYDRNLAIKMIQIQYEANLNGYSLFKSAIIAQDISKNSVAQIEESKAQLLGIETIATSKREYPNGTLAAHVIGYVSKMDPEDYKNKKNEGYSYDSIVGSTGIEKTLEKYLKGTDGIKRFEVDAVGGVTSETTVQDSISGNTVMLTIDYRLQKVAEEALKNTINDIRTGKNISKKFTDANAGAVVVLDVVTGEVLAMASYPTYDINEFVGGISNENWNIIKNNAVQPMFNRAISGTYSPGSTFKMLVGLAGLTEGKITTTEKINDPGIYPYGHNPKCWVYERYGTTHGNINLSQAIKVSCNCYFYEVGRRLGIDELVKYTKLFGLGQKTGIELADEYTGTIAGNNYKGTWYLGETLSAAIGQSGNSFTPIQLANYISTLANGGTLNKVTLIKDIKDSKEIEADLNDVGKYTEEYTGVSFESRNIDLKSEYIDAIKQGMLSVTTESGGTANIVFKNSEIQVAGKTGTAQVPDGSDNGIFVGFAPYDKPRIAVVAIIQHGGEGTYTANVVRPIMEEYFNITKKDTQNEKEQNVVNSEIKY